jgi:predicted PurR-regulated permease PerM
LNSKSVAHASLIQASVYAFVALMALLVVTASEVLLVVFGGILLAILFHGTGAWIHRKTGLNQTVALAIGLLLPLSIMVVGGWLIAPDIGDQASKLADRLPRAAEKLQEQLMQYPWISSLSESTRQLRELVPDGSSIAQYLGGFFSSTFGGLGNLLFALVVGVFLAFSPALYVNGLLQLVPTARQARARAVLGATAATLRNWLIAKLAAMAVIGLLTTVGLAVLGIDLALVLGIIAALLSFIPNFGPILSVIPAALIALVVGPDKALHVLALYAAIQAVESYALTPFLQKRLVQMPPALLLTMQVLFGVLAGVLGVIMATPLTAAGMVMIKMWYVEDLLHKHPAIIDTEDAPN